MKILLLFFLFPTYSFAAKGVVLVLEAPLLKTKDHKSEVINYVRKGDVIFINSKDIDSAPDEVRWELSDLKGIYLPEFKEQLDSDALKRTDEFYQTLSKGGYPVYIARKFVKVLYHDDREYSESVNPFSFDPTDYRPIEPLHDNFPFIRQDHRKAGVGLSMGPNRKINYPYPTQIVGEEFNLRQGFNVYYTGKIFFDDFNRFYAGAMFSYLVGSASFTLANDISTEESHRQYAIGPYLSYDFHRTKDYLLTVYGSISFNMDRFNVEQSGPSINNELRTFTGFSFTPRFGQSFQLRNILPRVDIYFSTEIQITFPHTLKSGSTISLQNIWQTWEDRVSIPFGGNINLFLGIQSIY